MTKQISALIDQLDTSSDKAAEKVIVKLCSIGKSAVPPLIKAANSEDAPRIRKWSLQALGAIGDKRAAPLLVGALTDERMTVRLHAVKGLARMNYKKAAKQIARCLKDESGGVRVNALYALIKFGDNSVSSQVQKSLLDSQWYVRQTACVACGNLGMTRAKKKLMLLSAKDERKAVRLAAEEALRKLAKVSAKGK